MANKAKQHDKEFKINAVKYIEEHPDLTQEECAKNLGIDLSTLSRWRQQYRTNNGDVPVRGSGNYQSDDQKEIARLKRELRDAEDALDVLKKPSAFWVKTDNCHLHGSISKGGGVQSCRTPRLHLRNAQTSGRLTFWIPCLSVPYTF